jgi:hypothetical protein
VVERDLAKVDVAGSTPVSRSRVLLQKPRAGEGFFNVQGRGTQVVRERSAKPLYVGSIPTRASNTFSRLHVSVRFRGLACGNLLLMKSL